MNELEILQQLPRQAGDPPAVDVTEAILNEIRARRQDRWLVRTVAAACVVAAASLAIAAWMLVDAMDPLNQPITSWTLVMP